MKEIISFSFKVGLLFLLILNIENIIHAQVMPGSVVEENIDTYLSTPSTGYTEEIPVFVVRFLPTLDGINIDVAQATA